MSLVQVTLERAHICFTQLWLTCVSNVVYFCALCNAWMWWLLMTDAMHCTAAIYVVFSCSVGGMLMHDELECAAGLS